MNKINSSNPCNPPSKPWRAVLCTVAAALAVASGLLPDTTHAALTDISSTPLAGTPAVQVKPNIMLLMDASGSMGWGHMPDDIETTTGIKSVGYKSSQCNSLYYNPATKYLLPKKPDPLATPFAAPSFTAAPYAGYASYYAAPTTLQNSVVDLSTSFQAYDATTLRTATTADTAQPAYYYVYSGGPSPSWAGAPCTDLDTYATDGQTTKTALGPNGGTWTRKVVSATSGPGGTDERANFAMWYSFYRIRISMIKSASSIAFNSLTDSFRVGFVLMQPKDSPTDASINPSKFLGVKDFNSTQRGLWFNSLFSQIPSGASPAREGLARVGRYFAGKQDSINTGMPATGANDPVQYSCQRNFTIMTTDGYWNAQTESPGGGPVDLDGKVLTDSQDSDKSNYLNKIPIYDGNAQPRVVEDHENSYSYAPCGSWAYLSTAQIVRSTSQILTTTSQLMQTTTQALQSTQQNLYSTVQNLRSTSEVTQSTSQPLQSTSQNLQSTTQNLQSTIYATQSTSQNLQSTQQNLRSTTQNLRSTTQNTATTSQVTQTVTTVRQSTTQNLRSTTQNLQSTTQTTQSTAQRLQSTTQNLQSTSQITQSTTQITQSTAQRRQATTQALQSTTQNLKSTTQVTQSTTQPTQSTLQVNKSTSQQTIATSQTTQTTIQDQSCNAATELCTYVPPGSCTAGGYISCQHYQAGPSLVASCTPTSPTAANNYLSTTCATTSTAPAGTSSCTPASATSSNNYTTTTCSTATTGPTPVASCTAASANSGNSWTTTTCSNATTGPTVVSSCTPVAASSSNSYTATTCSANTTGPTPVASCTPATGNSGNSYTTTTCGSNNTSSVAVASCTAATASSANSYTTTTCSTNNTSNVPVASCTAASPTAANNYTTTTCSSNNTAATPVASCTPVAASSTNSYVATVCSDNNTGPTPVASCSPVTTANSGNNYTTTSCGSNNTSNVGVASCSPVTTANAANNYTTTTCGTNNTTNVPVASCSGSSATSANGYTTTTCSTNNTSNVAVATCSASSPTSANAYVTTTCTNNNTGPTGVSSCTPVAASSTNSYVATTCGTNNTTNVAVASCSGSTPTAANGYTNTTCSTNNTTNVPVASCASASPTSANSYTTTTCSTNNTSNVLVASCSASGPTAGNGYTTTTCATTTVSGPTVVASCTPSAASSANGYQTTTCGTTGGTTAVAACVPSGPTAANNYTTTTCGTNNTTNVPVASCTASGPTAANNYTTTTCSTNNTTNVPVATCSASSPTAANNYTTTTCPAPVTSGPTAVASCTPVAASSGNNWVATTCTVGTTGPTAVASCSASSPTSANSYTTTTCANVVTTNVPVASCTASGPTSANGYKTTTCSTNNTTNVPVASCSVSSATSSNNYTTTSCSTNNTTNVPVASCTAIAPTSANNYTTTTCSSNNSGPVGVASCTPVSPTSANNYTTTSCGNVVTTNVPVATCTASGPTSANGYTTTTCPAPVTTGPTPIGTCTAQTASASNNWTTTTCPAPIVTTNVAVSSCTPAAASSGNNWTTTTCASNVNGPTAVASCTPTSASSANNWTATTCSTVPTTTPTASCTASGPTAANGYTTTTCPAPVVTGPTPVASCTSSGPTAGNSYTTVTCNTVTTSSGLQPSCTPDPATSANQYTSTICTPAPGSKIVYTTLNTLSTTQVDASGNSVGSPVVVSSTTGPTDATACYSPQTTPPALPTSPSPSGVVAGLGTLGPVPSGVCKAWPCDETSPDKKSVNSLADVAQYYYATSLRGPKSATWPQDPAKGGVKPVGDLPSEESDDATWQHMTTFAVGLGVAGTLTFDPNYRDAATTTADFGLIRAGVKGWPIWPDSTINYDPAHCDASGKCGSFDNWNDARAIDDFWHAAVNGRGQYFSAKDPTSVVAGLTAALGKIDQVVAAGSGAATSTFQPVAGDNFAYLGSYVTGAWSGEVAAWPIDLTTGLPIVNTTNTPPPIWSAQKLLGTRTAPACDTRQIYLMKPGANSLNMIDFSSGTSTCDTSGNPTGAARTALTSTEMAYFSSAQVQLLSQYASMTDGTLQTADQRTLATGSNLVNFLRGQRGLEDYSSGVATQLYRKRTAVLGDVIGSQPVFVSKPVQTYQDTGYSAFATANASRTPMLYVGANDGMLHAFYAGTSETDPQGGQEAWAVIPSAVLPNLYKLADANYKNTHQFYVDGTPTVGDAYDASSGTWKTILVGGLNAGGKGYYAIDVTNPSSPKGLWEFNASTACWPATTTSDCYVGLTFGQPLITKISYAGYPGGRWVVLVTSGYNNVHASPIAGDGQGYLYILDAITGQVVERVDTNAGSASTPSGLAQISAYANNGALDNSAVWVYGGDLLGNIWRFDVNDSLPPAGREATLIGQATDPSGVPQPITVRPELAEITGQPMVLIGTGEFLGSSDIATIQVQSVYGIVDPLTTTTAYPNLRASLSPMQLTQSGSADTSVRKVTCTATTSADCFKGTGWVVDLMGETGERVNVPMVLIRGELIFASNVPAGSTSTNPSTSACTSGGDGFLNYLNFTNGTAIGATNLTGSIPDSTGLRISDYVTGGLITGVTPIFLKDSGKYKAITRTSDTGLKVFDPPPPPPQISKGRISWREIAQ